MTQPQQQPHTPGEIIDVSRTQCRSRVWPGNPTTWTVTVGGTAATGDYSFVVSGYGGSTTITFPATVPTDTDEVIAQGLNSAFLTNLEALRIANSTVLGAVETVAERSVGQGFTLSTPVFPGGATLVLADATVTNGDLWLGLGVALVDDDQTAIRRLTTGDTAPRVFGVVGEGPQVKPNDGLASSQDGYAEGDTATIVCRGPVPVRVEQAITIVDPVFVRVVATGTELAGAFRIDADTADAVQLTNCRWLTDSYTDFQGRLVAVIDLNVP